MNVFEKFCDSFNLEYSEEMPDKLRQFAHAVDSTIPDVPVKEVRVLLTVLNNQVLFDNIVKGYFSDFVKKS